MNKSKLDKIEKALKPDLKSNGYGLAFEYPDHPEQNTYSVWDGKPMSGLKKVTKERFEELAQTIGSTRIVRISCDISET